ncbi:hypothetical protein Ddye_003480 [Dipteronia dyeriana]|uniref:Uncharacterized protein n=1 Tax=Dipteronia dyeriana TaxID=168575 RepID=A0AAD9XSB2_9ROSI|nr:hypothetical protein Ddye_003480 [Dipteronia dyeriana]
MNQRPILDSCIGYTQVFLPRETMRQYPLLEHLCIGSSCDSLRSLLLASFPKLKSLVVWDFANFSTMSITRDHMSIDALEIGDCPKLVSFPKGGSPTPNLTSIVILQLQESLGLSRAASQTHLSSVTV